MDTTFKTRKVRKFGGLAAGVVLCLGIVNMPSALAAGGDTTMTVNPSTNWVQIGDAALSVSGQGCLPAADSPATSPTASTADSPAASTDASPAATTANDTADSPAATTPAATTPATGPTASTDDSADASSATDSPATSPTADSTAPAAATGLDDSLGDIADIVVVVSAASDITDTNSWIDVVVPAADGSWSSTLVDADGTYYMPLSDSTKGGLATVFAWCVDLYTVDIVGLDASTADIFVTYTPVDVAVTGISQISGTTGQDVAVEADGFTPGETVTFVLSGGAAKINLTIGTGTADANGHVKTTINVPNTVAKDKYDLTLTGAKSARTFVTTVTVGIVTEDNSGDNGGTTKDKMPDLGAGVA